MLLRLRRGSRHADRIIGRDILREPGRGLATDEPRPAHACAVSTHEHSQVVLRLCGGHLLALSSLTLALN
jgi:hypothetical protein